MNEGGAKRAPRSLWLLLGVMVFVWSINFIVAKQALREFPPLLLGALRFTVAGAFILPVFLWKKWNSNEPVWTGPQSTRLLAIGVVGVGINQVAFLLGLVRTSVAHAALLIALTPVMVLLLSAWRGHERLTERKMAGFGMAVCGILLLQGRALLSGHGSPLGDLFVLFASLTFAWFTVAGKAIRKHFDPLTVNTYAYAGSSLVLSPMTVWSGWRFPFASVSATGWASVLYMAVFPSIVAYMIYYHALQYLPPSRVSMLGYLQPVIATTFAVMLLDESITLPLVLSGMLVLGGVLISERGA